ncbi:MAG: TIGR02206 family membrane protein [Clostridia bacterium]|nr:TIGR02206 family membrane protein [Clostridia bacterium]
MTMEYFWETTGSIKKGLGFSHFSSLHLAWIAFFLVSCIILSLLYRKCGETGRKRFRFTVAGLILLDEAAKWVMLLATGLWTKNYFPLQLCTINIFIIAWHTIKPSKLIDNFLYTICVPAAIMALAFPSWTKLPMANFMHIHSFTIHILLALYPIMLTVGGDIKPRAKYILKCLIMLICMAIPVYIFNEFMGTNYMFLAKADKGNPLYWFEQNWGNHLLGFPVLAAAIFLVMYGPLELILKLKKKKALTATLDARTEEKEKQVVRESL